MEPCRVTLPRDATTCLPDDLSRAETSLVQTPGSKTHKQTGGWRRRSLLGNRPPPAARAPPVQSIPLLSAAQSPPHSALSAITSLLPHALATFWFQPPPPHSQSVLLSFTPRSYPILNRSHPVLTSFSTVHFPVVAVWTPAVRPATRLVAN